MAFNFVYDKLTYTSNSITINNFSLDIPGKVLFKDSPLNISPGNNYALIGKNGCGKTSLLKQLALTQLFSENKISVLYVEQELDTSDTSPIEFIYQSNTRCIILTKELELIESDLNEENMDRYYELQKELAGFNKDTELGKIKSILHGLGFSDDKMMQPCNIFSGGWQMRISLARALYLKPDLLLLDEPTNHLDLEAIIWFGNYMASWKGIAIIVSHNIGFINETCNHIINVENQKLVTYKGNYFKFKESLEQKYKEQEKLFNNYEKKLKDFRKKNSAKNAVDEFIKKHQIAKPERPYEVSINFIPTSTFKSHIIKMNNVCFSYENFSLENINIGFDMTTRATLVGVNGSGKSTLMKLIASSLQPSSGDIWYQPNIRIGYYNQHFDDELPMDKTPVNYLLDIVPDNLLENTTKDHIIRCYLGRVKLESSAHNKLISELSGGQKARVAIVKLIFQQPHILLLDEPTNHLDIETVYALINGLKEFKGGVLLITHEPELINALDSELWVMNKDTQKVEIYNKTYEDYCEDICV